jgi:NAD(P)-dependent dehydrogenase (short-subunit alcohol dehydrogenase family)
MTAEQDFAGLGGIVTGAGSGIGQAATLEIAARGGEVLAVDLNGDAADETVRLAADLPGRVVAHRADTTDPVAVEGFALRLADEFERPWFFHNNAGVGGAHKPLVDIELDEWQRAIDINLNSYFFGLKYVLPVLVERGGGAVVLTGSLLSLKGAANRSDYTATKHAVLGLTRAAAAEVATSGVKVNCICPGPIETPLQFLSEKLSSSGGDPQAERLRFTESTPIGRYGTPEEIARAVAFLLSPAVPYLTGSALTVDGGLSAV